ncbi:alkyl hydroperoxide reductase [Hydrogenophaga crassostreae]|uniref:Alkyl hydroperoxide reductase n=1 Tax=Hydrogenophaga crassostreae TaxID=1763535 RepID=A0ABX2U965_9BURK|nr:alkyl hydroperoxide reductase [Hydrogenophaga crassostreae]
MALAVMVFTGVHLWQTRDMPAGPAPELAFTLITPDGARTATTLAQWRTQYPGQPVAIHVWAEWCPICQAEEHNVHRLVAGYPVLTIAMQSGPADTVAKVLRQRQLPWQTAVDDTGALAQALGVKAVPAFLVVDAQGQLRGASVGYTSEIGMRWRLWWARVF